MVIAECSVKETGTGTGESTAAGGEDQSSSAEVGIEATCKRALRVTGSRGCREEAAKESSSHQGQAGRSRRASADLESQGLERNFAEERMGRLL